MKIIWLGRFTNNPYFRKRVGQTQIIILVLPVQLKILIIQECLVTFKTNDYSKKKKKGTTLSNCAEMFGERYNNAYDHSNKKQYYLILHYYA